MEKRRNRVVSRVVSFFGLNKELARSGPAGKNNIATLDGVRAIAALVVVALHLNEYVGVPWNINANPLTTSLAVFGRTGVDLFFVLSGFLLFSPYAKALLFQGNWPSARTFYLRRMFRIWPGYYFSLILIILWYEQIYLQPDHWRQLALFLTFFMDSSPETWQRLNGPFWTLAIEWQFYLILPLIALFFGWIVKHWRSSLPGLRLRIVLGCCISLILLSLAWRGFGVFCHRNPSWTFLVPRSVLNGILFFTFGTQGKYLEVFGVGMTISVCYTYAQHVQFGVAFKERLLRLSDWFWKAGVLFLVCLAPWQIVSTATRNGKLTHFTGFAFLHVLAPYYAWLGEPLAGAGYGICVLAILFGCPGLKWLFELPFLRWVGMVSYALYMWNQRLLSLFAGTIFHRLPASSGILIKYPLIWLFVFLLMIPLCVVFFRLIEQPGIRLGNWLITLLGRKPEPKPALQTRERVG